MTKALPIWNGNPGITDYGGSVSKKDYNDMGPVDPDTDVSADQYVSMTSHVAAMTRTAPFAIMTVDVGDYGAGVVATVTAYRGFNGIGITQAPTVTWNAINNRTEIEFDSTYSDEFGQDAAISLGQAVVTVNDDAPYFATYVMASNSEAWVIMWDPDGSFVDQSSFTITIYRGN